MDVILRLLGLACVLVGLGEGVCRGSQRDGRGERAVVEEK